MRGETFYIKAGKMLFIKFVMGAYYLGAFDECPGTLLMFRVVATSIYL